MEPWGTSFDSKVSKGGRLHALAHLVDLTAPPETGICTTNFALEGNQTPGDTEKKRAYYRYEKAPFFILMGFPLLRHLVPMAPNFSR